MTVWKFIYIKFYEFRRWLLGRTLGEEYAAMLFVASLNLFFYWGLIHITDAFTGYVFIKKYNYLYALLMIGGALAFENIHKRIMCKKGAFERIKKQVEEEPNKRYWRLLSILFILFAFSFIIICGYLWAKKMIPPLV